ncbi:hypothetical protein M5K25_014413 [Dendrobium thyrsiflorum]|uniref:Protein CHROMATIN REMODELING 4 n=1 Tax=Dendrobium thyrsiflorum TaxID=117978 RepID=A0ABD0V2J7_DENTH
MNKGSSLHDKMLDRNWVLKRKRKQISTALDATTGKEGDSVLTESTKKSSSLRKKLKGEADASRCSQKVKGHDGYYFECEHCDLGGNLLCCDNCPRTYHLDCLNPPLKRAPTGNWICPKCCSQEVDKPSSCAETSSRRSRTKTTRKAMAVHIISSGDKTSHSGRNFLGSSKSTGKEKTVFLCTAELDEKSNSLHADVSTNVKSSLSGDNVLIDVVSTTAVYKKKKKKSVSPSKRKISAQKMAHSLVKPLNLDSSDKSAKKNPDSCRNENQGKKFDIPIVVSYISKKSRKKINKMDKFSSKYANREQASKISNDTFEEASMCPESSVSRSKRKSNENLSSKSSLKQETLLPKSSRLKKPEILSNGAYFMSHELSGRGENSEMTMTYNEDFFHGIPQVARILGCRVQTESSCISQAIGIATSQAEMKADIAMLQTEFPSFDSTGQQNHDQVDCFDGSEVGNGKLENTMDEAFHGDANLIALKIAVNSIESGKDVNGKTYGAREFMSKTEDELLLICQPSLNHNMADKKFELSDDGNFGDLTVKKCLEKNIHVEFLRAENYIEAHTPRSSEMPANCVSQDAPPCTMGPESYRSSEDTIVPKESELELRPKDIGCAAYEFFVKWAGKSNIHNTWVLEDQLKVLAKRKLENYKAKYGMAIINICEEQWFQPQRIISLSEPENGGGKALVKWCGLPYDECTWEKFDEPVIQNTSHLFSELKQFESHTSDKDASADFVRTDIEVFPLVEQPKELKGGSLFPHQLEALNWLRKCWQKSKNVILADEMGLGKTVSACAFISSLYFEFRVKLPCLVLVPLSTMPNWLSEFVSWAPHLNVVEYHGSAKARSVIRQYEWHASDANRPDKLSKAYKFNVLLTTYEMILADSSHLRGVPWEVLIVDEGHRLKNSRSKLFSLLNTFSFQHLVLLTGTPLQNNLGEMYNLLNFLQPCSFPSFSSFEEKFNDLSTAEKVEELKKLVAPHMLRRLKKDAMQDIPPKTERMVPVELTSLQAEYYRAMLTKNYQILRNIRKGVAQQSMLNVVMQLRKVCNHPYLIPGTEPESGTPEFLQEMRIKASAKLTLLHSMLKILHKEGHRVLIFSQMTKLLDILEDYLTIEFGPATFERVDGSLSVADRQAAIARFNRDKARFVFLLSTRSCGLGINLATADTVIIYDSDFNPHADIQAMNRAHRIGQSNRLLVYRLVVRASVEERILQLAKKKLMLDQLFVSKSGSQKEVEDILRWGTEELFTDSDAGNCQDVKNDCINNVDTIADGERKHRRRAGGLGDVYKDRCTISGTRISWDENAILKLLDRSSLQSGISENIDGGLEHDMLGSVKSLDWNVESINEETGGSEVLPNLSSDDREPSPNAKEDNTKTLLEENEWDRLLRVRWEAYQVEEEEVLGRGKRLKKAISYKETFGSMPNEALSESGNEEEPRREYTPAGQALKEKFAKLRARQKERLAERHITGVLSSVERPELSMQSLLPSVKGMRNGDTNNDHKEDACKLDLSVKPEETKSSLPFDSRFNSNSMVKNLRTMRNGHKRDHGSYLDLSVSTTENLSAVISPSKHFQKTSLATSVSSSNLLPVLGLCAPNASLRHSTARSFRTPVSKQTSHHGKRRSVALGLPEFLSVPADVSAGPFTNTSGTEALSDPLTMPDKPREVLNHRLKNIIPDNYFPFGSPPMLNVGSLSDMGESSGTSFSSFHEKIGLPKLDLNDRFPVKYAFPPCTSLKQQTDFLPSLSLTSKMELANSCNPDLSNVPLVPMIRQELDEKLKKKLQLPEFPPVLGLGTMQTSHMLPENHKKVLDNIIMRTRTAAHKFSKKRLKGDAWSEDELDALWIGVRRHGRGNWDAMLRDPKFKVLKHKSIEELSSRWSEEQLKIIDGPATFSQNSNYTYGLSDRMMAQALHDRKFSAIGQEQSPRSHSHLTDIKLACGDLLSKFPCLEQSSQLGAVNESVQPLPFGPADKLGSSYFEALSAGMTNRLEKTILPLDQFVRHNSLPGSLFGAPEMISRSNHSLLRNEDVLLAATKTTKSPISPDKSPNLLHVEQRINSGESSALMPFYAKKKRVFSRFPLDDDSFPGSSKANKLPHWLREAVSAPSNHHESELPPSVSSIMHSVRLLYGEEKSTIPPFVPSGPPPLQPKDPRKNLRKRRKLERLQQAIPDALCSVSASVSIPTEPPLIACSIPPQSSLMGYCMPSVPPPTHFSIPPVLPPSTIPSFPPLFPPSIHPIPSLFPYSIPPPAPAMPTSIPSAPLPFMQSSFLPVPPLPAPPFFSSFVHSMPILFQSSSSTALSIPCPIPVVPPFPQDFIPAEPSLIPCSFLPTAPLTSSSTSMATNETFSTLQSMNLNLNSPSSGLGIQSPAMLPLAAPHALATPSAPDAPTPTLSHESSEIPASKDPEPSQQAGEDLVKDFNCFHMKQEANINSNVDCEEKLQCGNSNNATSDSSSADELNKVHENSSKETVSDPKNERES